jgi:hypothetical protein
MSLDLTSIEAESMINTLSSGVPDADHIMAYSSSLDNELMETISKHLDKVKRGITVARFVKGDNGSGKSHFLSVVREIALRDNYVVSYFDLRSREGFDMIERIFSKLIKTLSVNNKRKGTVDETVLDFAIKTWANQVQSIEESISKMDLDATNIDFLNAINIYGKIMAGIIPRQSNSHNLVQLINRWFQAEGLQAKQRQKLNVNNNIVVRNARDILDSLSIFFREIGYSGWVILIDEQEIIPTLMATKKRDLSNENLKVIIDTQPKTKFMYYLFATTPEFFNHPEKGINSYPALRQRVLDVLEVKTIGKNEMVEVGEKIKEIYCKAFLDFQRGSVTGQDIRNCASHVETIFGNTSAKARIFIVSYIRLLNKLYEAPESDIAGEFESITGQVWDELEKKEKEAYHKFI